MHKHKFKSLNKVSKTGQYIYIRAIGSYLTESNTIDEYICLKCNECYCDTCCENIKLFKNNDYEYNINIIMRKYNDCILSDEEFIIKQIIE